MIRPGFLGSESRRDLIELARDGSAAHRLARCANALVLLDKGMSCQSIGEVLLLLRHHLFMRGTYAEFRRTSNSAQSEAGLDQTLFRIKTGETRCS
jgi:hypothetical protein